MGKHADRKTIRHLVSKTYIQRPDNQTNKKPDIGLRSGIKRQMVE